MTPRAATRPTQLRRNEAEAGIAVGNAVDVRAGQEARLFATTMSW